MVAVRAAWWVGGHEWQLAPHDSSCGRGGPRKGVRREEHEQRWFYRSFCCSQGGWLRGARVVQSGGAAVSLVTRPSGWTWHWPQGGRTWEKGGEPLPASSVGPGLDAGVTPRCSPQKAVLWQIQKPLPSSLALTVPGLLTPELTHLGTLFKWQHLCCCHKGEVVSSCCSTQILGWAN